MAVTTAVIRPTIPTHRGTTWPTVRVQSRRWLWREPTEAFCTRVACAWREYGAFQQSRSSFPRFVSTRCSGRRGARGESNGESSRLQVKTVPYLLILHYDR